MAQLVKNTTAMWETSVWCLGWEDPLEKGMVPTPVFWPGEFHGLYSPRACKESGTQITMKCQLTSEPKPCCPLGHKVRNESKLSSFQYRRGHVPPIRCLIFLTSVQSLSHVWLFATPWTATRQASMSTANSQSLLKFMSIESVMPSNHLILCWPLLFPPSIFPSIRVFSNESVLHIRWPKYWSFSFSISLSNEYSGLLSFRMDWLDLLEIQGVLKSLLQHHSTKASILWHSASFMVQLSDPYMTTGKTTTWTRWNLLAK